MGNPVDIVNVQHLYGMNQQTHLTNASTFYDIMDAVATDYVHKVNQIIVSNIDGANNCDVNIGIELNGTIRYLIFAVTIPADSSLSVIDTPLYLHYDANVSLGERLQANAQTGADLDVVVSWEAITDVA